MPCPHARFKVGSGYSREDLARRFPGSLAFDHHLVKPADPDKLRDLLAVLGG